MEEKKMSRRDFLGKTLQWGAMATIGSVLLLNSGCTKDNYGKYSVDTSKCTGCGRCLSACSHGAISLSNKVASISSSRCVGCGRCVGYCTYNAIS